MEEQLNKEAEKKDASLYNILGIRRQSRRETWEELLENWTKWYISAE